MIRHFTVTTYLLHEEKTLLIYHPKFKKWLPPGGHLEENELPQEGAKREVREETGLEIDFLPDEHFEVHSPFAISLQRPHFCWLEKVPPFGDQPAHEHIDLIFLARPLSLIPLSPPAHPNQWWSFAEIEQLFSQNRDVLFLDTYQVLQHIMLKPVPS